MPRTLRVAVLIVISLSLICVSSLQLQSAHAYSLNPSARNVNLYWHYATIPVGVGATQTHYMMNSSANFDFQTQASAKQNSIYKATPSASISVDFFVYPNLAGPAHLNGTWQIFVSANASGSHPAAFNIEFREYALGSGTSSWDSGQLNPIVSSPIGPNLDSPVYSYNLTTSTALDHTFSQGSSIDVSVTINDGASGDTRIWYDSASYPSKVIFPVVNPGQPAKIWTADSSGAVKSSFPVQSQTVMVAANVTDPFGGYDVNATVSGAKNAPVTLTVTSPSGSALVSSQRMTQLSGGSAVLDNLFRYNFTTPATAGNYTATVSSTDNSGNTEQLSYTFTLAGSPPPSSILSNSLLIPILVIVAVIAVVLALVLMTRRKKSRTHPA